MKTKIFLIWALLFLSFKTFGQITINAPDTNLMVIRYPDNMIISYDSDAGIHCNREQLLHINRQAAKEVDYYSKTKFDNTSIGEKFKIISTEGYWRGVYDATQMVLQFHDHPSQYKFMVPYKAIPHSTNKKKKTTHRK